MSLVYDCFLFFNEFDLLEIRLNILSEVVDKFVLVEADKTFSNIEKPYYFDQCKERYKQFLDKIVHIKINEYPETKDAWEMESYQRNHIGFGISQCSFADIIHISDLDEIPNPEIIKIYKETGNGICGLKQFHFDYYLNYERYGKNHYWYNAKIARYKDIVANNYKPQNIRSEKNVKIIKKGGWHFSFLGGIENIKYKVQSFAHQEYNDEKYLNDQIEYKIRLGVDLFNRKNIRLVPIKISDKKHPRYIVDNQEKYSHLICPYINRYIAIKNKLYCMPYHIVLFIKRFLKMVLTKNMLQKIKGKLRKKTKKDG